MTLLCALPGVALVMLFPELSGWLGVLIYLLFCLVIAGGAGGFLCLTHKRKLSVISEEAQFKDAILRFVRESSDLKTRDALYSLILETAVQAIPHATAGSLLKVVDPTPPGSLTFNGGVPDGGAHRIGQRMRFEAAYGHELAILRTLSLRLEETFNYVLTKGKCDRTVVVHQYRQLNQELLEPEVYEQLEKGSSDISDSSIMSAPVYVDSHLWGMLTIDSAAHYDFEERHIDRLEVFVNETVKIIRLFREQERNLWLMRHDPLTELLNRAYFSERFKTDLEAAARGELHGTLVSMDLDCFKAINDQFGHAHGDEALRHFARIFTEQLSETDYLSRYGGDEFVAVFLNQTEPEVQKIIKTIAGKLLENPLPIGQHAEGIRFSHGMVAFNQAFHDHQQIMHASDAFMYECKREHREMRF